MKYHEIIKSVPYKQGRKAGTYNKPREDNPYPIKVGEHGDWDLGWLDGYNDIGWSKTPKKSIKSQ